MRIRDYLSAGLLKAGLGLAGDSMAKHRAGGIVVETLTGDWFEEGQRAPSTRETLIASTPIQAAVRLISTSVADLICNTLYIVNDDDERVEPNDAQRGILNLFRYAPNEVEDGYAFTGNLVADMLLEGNGLCGIERSGQRVSRLYRMVPKEARIGVNAYGADYYTGPVSMFGGAGMTFIRGNMVHAKLVNFEGANSGDDRKGFVQGPLQTLMKTMQISGLMDDYIVNYFSSDANGLRLFVRATDVIGKDDLKETRRYVGDIARKNKGVAFLQSSLEPVRLETTAIDAQMAALRTFQVREASRIWGVPVPMLGEEKSGTSIPALKQDFWQNCVKPHANAVLSAMTQKLLNQRNASKGFRFAIDPTEMIKGDPDTMAKLLPALGDAQRPGVLAPTEWRKAGGWPVTMPDETDTDRRVREELKERQAGLPSGGGPGGPAAQINTDDSKELGNGTDD